jgi:hypothetical protein
MREIGFPRIAICSTCSGYEFGLAPLTLATGADLNPGSGAGAVRRLCAALAFNSIAAQKPNKMRITAREEFAASDIVVRSHLNLIVNRRSTCWREHFHTAGLSARFRCSLE